jgi:GT2 family glycosyltransferase
MDCRISLVIVTRNRRVALGRTLEQLLALPESPQVVVVDNASSDGTAEFVRLAHPRVELIVLPENLGAAARTLGVRAAETPYVAFSDDDSWWKPGSLSKIADTFDVHPRLALVAACVLVGQEKIVDPVCMAMASSPLPAGTGLHGPAVLGFVSCGAAIRRAAFLDVGGFEARYGVGGEEELLAIDLAAAGWSLVYCRDVIAYHHPDASGPRPGRRRLEARNALWSLWLRRPLTSVIRQTARPCCRN